MTDYNSMTQSLHPKVECAYEKIVSIDELIENPRNPNKHSTQQIELLAKIMRAQGIRSPIVVSNRSGFITKGHGRLAAAKLNGWESYPVDFQDYESEAKEYADMVADNKIAELAESDMGMILEDARKLKDEIGDFDLLGIPDFKLEATLDPSLFPEPDEKEMPSDKDSQLIKCPNCGVLVDG